MKGFAFLAVITILLAITPRVHARDGYPTIGFGGRAQLDYAFYDDDLRELGDGGEVRRARLFAAGNLAEHWEYKAQFDFAGGDVATKDLYLAYTGLPAGTVTIGQFKQPLSLENLTSSKYLTFIERALPVGLASDRRLGLGFDRGGDNYTFAASLYGQEIEEEGLDEGLGASARFAFTPVRSESQLLHFGIAGAWEEAPDASNTLRLRERPESHVTSVRLVDTGTIANVDDLTRVGLEAAWVRGPFSLQGEMLGVDVNRSTGTDFTGKGWYVFGSWFLTGESRLYKGGAFGRVKPVADSGAWELALRYSTLDFDDGAVSGGEEDNLTLGINYYVTSHLKFQGNYTQVESTREGISDDPNILQFRVAFDF